MYEYFRNKQIQINNLKNLLTQLKTKEINTKTLIILFIKLIKFKNLKIYKG